MYSEVLSHHVISETLLDPVLGIRILTHFLGLLDPDPLVRGTYPDPDPPLFS